MTKNNRKRIRQTPSKKRMALLEISKGAGPNEIIINQTGSLDKKYSSKMLHKWKKESYLKRLDLDSFSLEVIQTDIDVANEINAFEYDIGEAENNFNCFKHEYIEDNTNCTQKGYSVFSNLCLSYG